MLPDNYCVEEPLNWYFISRSKRRKDKEAAGRVRSLVQYYHLRGISWRVWNCLRYFKIFIYSFIPHLFAKPPRIFCGTLVEEHCPRQKDQASPILQAASTLKSHVHHCFFATLAATCYTWVSLCATLILRVPHAFRWQKTYLKRFFVTRT